MRRKPMFFTYNLVFPCVLLMGIGILVFCLPPESGEKVSLSVTVLLAMTVYQLLINTDMLSATAHYLFGRSRRYPSIRSIDSFNSTQSHLKTHPFAHR